MSEKLRLLGRTFQQLPYSEVSKAGFDVGGEEGPFWVAFGKEPGDSDALATQETLLLGGTGGAYRITEISPDGEWSEYYVELMASA